MLATSSDGDGGGRLEFECSQVYKGPFKYYVIIFRPFLGQPTSLMIYSTVNHQKLPFSDPTHPPL